jgi:hypothetical protein
MKFFSFLGSEEFYLMVAPAILWCWNFALGLRLGLFLMVSATMNSIFKMIFHGPRPYWVDTRINSLGVETSFGVPSGHAQNAVIVWGTLAAHCAKLSGWILAVAIMFLIGLSRLALGMHYPHDVLVGWILGAILLWILLKVSPPIITWLKSRKTYEQLIAVFVSSLGLILLGLITQWFTGNFYIPSEWIKNSITAHPDVPIAPFALSGFFTNAGVFFGLSAGAVLLEQKGGFSTRGKWWQLILRYLVGVLGVLAIRYGLGAIFPDGEEIIPYILRYLRYAMVGIWVTGLAPYLFCKLKLASFDKISPPNNYSRHN